MTRGFRGSNQAAGTPYRKGAIAQWRLLPMMRALIDIAARDRHDSPARTQARATLREIHDTCNWNTSFILRNIGLRRCRYLRGMGWEIPDRFLRLSEERAAAMRRDFGWERRR